MLVARAGSPDPIVHPELLIFTFYELSYFSLNVAIVPHYLVPCRSSTLLLVGNGADALASVAIAGLTATPLDFVPANQVLTLTTAEGDLQRAGAVERYLARRTAHGAASLEGSTAFEIGQVRVVALCACRASTASLPHPFATCGSCCLRAL